jgi:hypothetical protein
LTVGRWISLQGKAIKELRDFVEALHPPARRNLAEFGVLEGVRKKIAYGCGEAGVAAFGFRAYGIEVHEPGFEERPRHRLRNLVHLSIQVDLTIYTSQEFSYPSLPARVRNCDGELCDFSQEQSLNCAAVDCVPSDRLLQVGAEIRIKQEPTIETPVFGSQKPHTSSQAAAQTFWDDGSLPDQRFV